jgi:tetratricopeptide (TPR) repeat protein
MPGLATTLRSLTEYADSLWYQGRQSAALGVYEDLLQRSQERTDRMTEVIARSMLALCCLRRKALEEAQLQLRSAGRYVDPEHLDSYERYRAALCRLAIEGSSPEAAKQELLDYLAWAEERQVFSAVLDACLLLGRTSNPQARVDWLQRGIEQARVGGAVRELGRAYMELAACQDQLGLSSEALESYEQSLHWHESTGQPRDIISATWAVGSLCVREEDWPKAREVLEKGQKVCLKTDGCDDLLALIIADLALVYEAAGDVVEARRLVIQAISLAREQSLDGLWPQRWRALREHAKSLELDV